MCAARSRRSFSAHPTEEIRDAHNHTSPRGRQSDRGLRVNEPETELLGCVYIDPPEPESPSRTAAVVSWWVIDDAVGSDLEHALDDFVPRWRIVTAACELIGRPNGVSRTGTDSPRRA
jgi:hypothetical protein